MAKKNEKSEQQAVNLTISDYISILRADSEQDELQTREIANAYLETFETPEQTLTGIKREYKARLLPLVLYETEDGKQLVGISGDPELNPTAPEYDRMKLQDELNKMQDAITNLEDFFKNQTEVYISNLFTQYDLRMLAMEQDTEKRLTAVEDASDAKIQEIQDKITETTAWQNDLMAEMYDSQYFDFDNVTYKTGFTRKTENVSENVSVETIYNTIDNSVFATRTTTKNGDKDYTIQVICDKVVPAINTISHMYKLNDVWYEEITAG